MSQRVISLQKLKFSKSVHAFTEHGALMAATVLNSPRAVAVSLYVAFHVSSITLRISACGLET